MLDLTVTECAERILAGSSDSRGASALTKRSEDLEKGKTIRNHIRLLNYHVMLLIL
jgi:hypothetical protein